MSDASSENEEAASETASRTCRQGPSTQTVETHIAEAGMKTFIINVVLPLLVAGSGYLITTKSSFDGRQRASLTAAILCIAYFCCHTVEKKYVVATPSTSTPVVVHTETTKKSGDAHSGGNQSPANTGDGNSFEYNNGETAHKPKKSKEKK